MLTLTVSSCSGAPVDGRLPIYVTQPRQGTSGLKPFVRMYIPFGLRPHAEAALVSMRQFLQLLNLRSGVPADIHVSMAEGVPEAEAPYALIVEPSSPLTAGEEYGLRLLPNPRYVHEWYGEYREELTQFFVGSRPRVSWLSARTHFDDIGGRGYTYIEMQLSEVVSSASLRATGAISLRDVRTGVVTPLALMPVDAPEQGTLYLPLGSKDRWNLDHPHVLRISRSVTTLGGVPLDGGLTWPGPAEDFELLLPAKDFARIYSAPGAGLRYRCDTQRWWTGNGPAAIPLGCTLESHK